MNTRNTAAQGAAQGDDELDLGDLLQELRDNRNLIAAITAAAVFVGGAYALLTTPIYETNLLLQVEDTAGGSAGKILFGELTPLMSGAKNTTQAEIEILRSRMIVSQPVEALGLNVQVRPKYFPLIGRTIARHSKSLSEPGLLGYGGYVWGSERIDLGAFDVPPALYGRDWEITVQANNAYTVTTPQGQSFHAEIGQYAKLETAAGTAELLVRSVHAKPGARFVVNSGSKLATVEELRKQLKVEEQGKSSGMINVSLRGSDPVLTTAVLNTIGQEYVAQNVRRKSEEAEKTLAFLDEQLPTLKKDLEATEGRYNSFRQKNGAINLSEEGKALLERVMTLESKQIELKQKKIELSARYGPSHPSMIAADAALQKSQNEVDRLANQAKAFPATEQEALRLERDVKVAVELYTGLLQSAQQLRVAKAGKVGNVRLIDAAVVPEGAVQPQRTLVLVVSLLCGLILGVAVVFLRRMLRNTIQGPDDVELRTGLAVLASVPHSPAQEMLVKRSGDPYPNEILAQTHPNEPSIEGLRSFMTALQFSLPEPRNQIVLLSGPTQGVGKSFVSVNFAALLAQSGLRVLLIDGDLRRGHLHRYFGLSRAHGLTELILGKLEIAKAVRANVLPNLDFMPTGQLPPNPAELWRRPAVTALLPSLREQYDLVLMDTAPILPVSDTAIVASLADACVLVVRENISANAELAETVKRLGHVGVKTTGVLLNDMKARRHRYGYAYEYGYAEADMPRSRTLRSRIARFVGH